MPLVLKNNSDRAALQFAHAAALRSSDEIVDQMRAQLAQAQAELAAKRAPHEFNIAQTERSHYQTIAAVGRVPP